MQIPQIGACEELMLSSSETAYRRSSWRDKRRNGCYRDGQGGAAVRRGDDKRDRRMNESREGERKDSQGREVWRNQETYLERREMRDGRDTLCLLWPCNGKEYLHDNVRGLRAHVVSHMLTEHAHPFLAVDVSLMIHSWFIMFRLFVSLSPFCSRSIPHSQRL